MNCEEIIEPFLKCFSLIQMSNAAERSKAVGISLFRKLRGSLPKSVPLDFGLEKTFAS